MARESTKKAAEEEAESSKKKVSKKCTDPAALVAALCKDMEGVHTMDDEEATNYLSTGHLGIDYIMSGKWLNGGIPRRKLIECFGPAASAKSALMYLLCASVQRIGGVAALIDVEGGRNEEFMKMLKIDLKKLIVLEPVYQKQTCFTIETCFQRVRDFVVKTRESGFEGPLFIGIDSIAALPSFGEWKEVVLEGKIVKEDQGRRAKIIGTWQRALNNLLRDSDTTLMVINQIRERVGVMFGNKEITTSGRSTEFYSDCRIDIRRRKSIKRTTFKAKSADGEEEKEKIVARKLGGFFKVTCEKSRQTAPWRVCDNVEIYFNHGIAPFSGMFDLMLMDELAVKSTGAYYILVDPETRHDAVLKELDGTKFMRRDIEEGSWILDHPEFFGASSDELKNFLEANETAHRFSMALRKALRDKRAELEDDEEEDDDEAESAAVKKLKGGGRFVKAKKPDIPADETGDEEA